MKTVDHPLYSPEAVNETHQALQSGDGKHRIGEAGHQPADAEPAAELQAQADAEADSKLEKAADEAKKEAPGLGIGSGSGDESENDIQGHRGSLLENDINIWKALLQKTHSQAQQKPACQYPA